ncbi:MAG: ABC transporter substrate-binding protein [Negativicutes bacterium]|nr:ABC transporter substrate-binding protein [Negativicutes bacterium]
MKKPSKAAVFVLCISLCAMVLFAGCGQKSGNNAPADGAKLVTVATSIQPCYNSVPMDIADKKGYYKSFGVNAPLQVFTSGGPQNEALAAGKWDIGMLGMAAALSCIRYDAKIIAVADYEGAAIKTLVRKDSEILKVVQFDANGRPSFKPGAADAIRGKTIVTTVGTSGHYSVGTMLKALGLTFNDVKILNMDQPSVVAAFKAGQGDLATVWAPYTWPLLNEGAVSINDIVANGSELPAVILVRGEYYKNPANREAIKNWLKAYFKGIDDMKRDKQLNMASTKAYLKDQGYDPTDKQLEAEVADKPLFNLKEQIDLFDPAKGKNGMGDAIYQFSLQADYLVGQQVITKEQRDKFVKESFTDEFLKELLAGK